MIPRFDRSLEDNFYLQKTSLSGYREPREMKQSKTIVCSKKVSDKDTHSWILKGSSIFSNVLISNVLINLVSEQCLKILKIKAEINSSVINDNSDYFITTSLRQYEQFAESFIAYQNSGIPKSIEEICEKAEALMDVICKVEGLKKGSFHFMLNQFVRKQDKSDDVIIVVA